MCNCKQLEDVVNCGDNELEEFIKPRALRLVRERPEARLYVCPECGTFWQVDHNMRGPQAIKVEHPFSWENFDDRPHRLRFMERFHGGSSDQPCQWTGCSHRALK